MSVHSPRICIAITGATGSIYAEALVRELLKKLPKVYLIISKTAASVIRYELAKEAQLKKNSEAKPELFCLVRALQKKTRPKNVVVYDNDDFFAPVASGTSAPDHLILLPCSMGTIARVAHGDASHLIERAADVVLKQKKTLSSARASLLSIGFTSAIYSRYLNSVQALFR